MTSLTLSELLEKQKELMKALGVDLNASLTSSTFRDTLLSLISEVSEVYNELPPASKPWRPQDEGWRDRVAVELVDILFFLLELLNLAKLDGYAVSQIYERKMAELQARLRLANTK